MSRVMQDHHVRPGRARLTPRGLRRPGGYGGSHRDAAADRGLTRSPGDRNSCTHHRRALRAGTKENIIPDDAELLLSIRTFEPSVLAKVMAAIERIVNAEAAAAGAPKPPEIIHMQSLP